MKARRGEGVLGAAILIGIVLLALFFAFAPSDGANGEGAGSVASSRSKGRRALFLMLQELGFAPRAWTDAPSLLPRDQSILWLPSVPTKSMPSRAGVDSFKHADPERLGLHALEHYRSFVEAGGTIVLAAGDDTTRFLVDELGLDAAATLKLDHGAEADIRSVRTKGGDSLSILARDPGQFEPLDPNGEARELWTVEEEGVLRPFAVEIPDAAGSVVVLANDEWVANDTIGANDHALGAVRLIEDLQKSGGVLFSEYEIGRWSPPSTLSLLFSPRLFLASLHVFVLLGLFVWMHAFARAFPRDPEALSLFSPVLRARGLADLFARARRFGTLAASLRRGVLDRLQRAARLHARSSSATAPATASLPRVTAADVSAFARAAGLMELEPRLLKLLVTQPIRRRADLDALEAALRGLENDVEGRLKQRARPVASRA